ASPGNIKPLVANLAGVDKDFGVADVVELYAVFQSVSDMPDDLRAVLLVVAGAQYHRNVVLVAGDHLIACRVYVDGIEAIQVDESPVFRQHPHRFYLLPLQEVLPPWYTGGKALPADYVSSTIRASSAVASVAFSFARRRRSRSHSSIASVRSAARRSR